MRVLVYTRKRREKSQRQKSRKPSKRYVREDGHKRKIQALKAHERKVVLASHDEDCVVSEYYEANKASAKRHYEYDPKTKLLYITITYGEDDLVERQVLYESSEDGKVLSRTEYSSVNGILEREENYYYSSNGLIEIVEVDSDGDGETDSAVKYVYDNDVISGSFQTLRDGKPCDEQFNYFYEGRDKMVASQCGSEGECEAGSTYVCRYRREENEIDFAHRSENGKMEYFKRSYRLNKEKKVSHLFYYSNQKRKKHYKFYYKPQKVVVEGYFPARMKYIKEFDEKGNYRTFQEYSVKDKTITSKTTIEESCWELIPKFAHEILEDHFTYPFDNLNIEEQCLCYFTGNYCHSLWHI